MRSDDLNRVLVALFSPDDEMGLEVPDVDDELASQLVMLFGVAVVRQVFGERPHPDDIHRYVVDRYVRPGGVPAAWQVEAAARFLAGETGVARGMPNEEMFDAIAVAARLLAAHLESGTFEELVTQTVTMVVQQGRSR